MGRQSSAKRPVTAEFRVEAVRVLRERLAAGLTWRRVSDELEVNPGLLRRWAKQVEGAPPGTPAAAIFPGKGQRRQFRAAPGGAPPDEAESLEEEVRRLRRENDRLRQERDFLKKAAAFFARESP